MWIFSRFIGSFSFVLVLQLINLNESFRHYNIHREDYVTRFKKTVSSRSRDIQKSAKTQN